MALPLHIVATLVAALVALPAGATGQPAPDRANRASAARRAASATASATTHAPTIDGRDDDAAWKQAPALDQFLEFTPRQDAQSRFRTTVRFAYDRASLFVFARMYDPAPDSIMDRLGRRDLEYPADRISLTIDGYRDRRTAHEFRVSAGGGVFDALITGDANTSLDASWDAVWDAAVRIDDEGWTAELRIPFSQLRFAGSAPVFGLVVRREVGREDAQLAWPRIDFNRMTLAWVSQGGDLVGLHDIVSSAPLEVAPYVVGRNETRHANDAFTHPSGATLGADARYRITPNLTLSATMNPDFGQVESDPAQLNLSSFELFYPEKRQFFLEGSSIFSFLAWCDEAASAACKSPFYSRRIGRTPQLTARYGDDASPLTARIDGALKLAGRVHGGLSLGVLAAQSRREAGTLDRTIEPRTRLVVARLRQETFGGRGDVGGIVTYAHRDLDAWTEPFLRREALVTGLDTRRRFGPGLEVQASLLHSRVAGSPVAMTALQRDPVHRYQQPGDGLFVDTTRESLTGESGRLSLVRSTGGLRYELSYQRTTPGFEMNDLGYEQRADRQWARVWFERFTRRNDAWFRSRRAGLFSQLAWTASGVPVASTDTPWPNLFSPYMITVLRSTATWRLRGYLASPNRAADDRVTRGGQRIPLEPALGAWTQFTTDSRRNVVYESAFGMWQWDAGHSNTQYGHVAATLRPTPTLQAVVSLFMQHIEWDQSYHSNRRVLGTDSVVSTFAHLRTTQADPQLRLDWTLSPRTTLQLFAQPYTVVGAYSDWRDLVDPSADSYEERWRPHPGEPGGYAQQQFISSAVWRWEYRPGATLYVIWQHRRNGASREPTAFNPSREFRTMAGLHPLNTLLVKVSYWINPR